VSGYRNASRLTVHMKDGREHKYNNARFQNLDGVVFVLLGNDKIVRYPKKTYDHVEVIENEHSVKYFSNNTVSTHSNTP
jgi:hypothetical protein